MKYQLLIIWGDVEPELWPKIYDDYEVMVKEARRVRENEGDEDGLYYLQWKETWINGHLVKGHVEVHSFGAWEIEPEEDDEDEFPYGTDRG